MAKHLNIYDVNGDCLSVSDSYHVLILKVYVFNSPDVFLWCVYLQKPGAAAADQTGATLCILFVCKGFRDVMELLDCHFRSQPRCLGLELHFKYSFRWSNKALCGAGWYRNPKNKYSFREKSTFGTKYPKLCF